MKILAIDASNLREGGGVTHLVELLRTVEPLRYGFGRIILWSVPETLDRIDDRPWLDKRAPRAISRGGLRRIFWQWYTLAREARAEGCDLLFSPGGTLLCNFHPAVTMCRNMLPFEATEVERYGISLRRLRLLLLRRLQSMSFRKADGLVFLTDYARNAVLKIIGSVSGMVTTIPHGVSEKFHVAERVHRKIATASSQLPFRLIYVSHASPYKHQWNVISAVASLRARTNWPVVLDMVGPLSIASSVNQIKHSIAEHDFTGEWAHFHGPEPREKLQERLSGADAAVFASSCENMPNILLEKMAAGLPIACSSRGPMPEILKNAGEYFDPECPVEIAAALEKLISDSALRQSYALKSISMASRFSWERCTDETFLFLSNFLFLRK